MDSVCPDRILDDWIWPAAEEAGLPLALAAANFLPKVGAIAARHPDLKLLIDHLGMPLRQTDDAALTNLSQLVALSQYPNIAIKATAAPGSSTEPYPYRNLHNYLETLFDSYGPSRMFWGTDITRMSCSYRQCVTMFTEELKWLKGKDLELVMGKAVCDWIGWDLGA